MRVSLAILVLWEMMNWDWPKSLGWMNYLKSHCQSIS